MRVKLSQVFESILESFLESITVNDGNIWNTSNLIQAIAKINALQDLFICVVV